MLLLFIVFLLVGCAAGKVVGNKIVHKPKSFECDLLGEDWKINANNAYDNTALQFINKHDGTYITIWTSQATGKNKELEGMAILNRHFDDLAKRESTSNFKLISKDGTLLDNVKAGLGAAEYEINRIPKRIKTYDANFNNIWYEVILFGDRENCGKHVSEFDNFIKTFKFIRK